MCPGLRLTTAQQCHANTVRSAAQETGRLTRNANTLSLNKLYLTNHTSCMFRLMTVTIIRRITRIQKANVYSCSGSYRVELAQVVSV